MLLADAPQEVESPETAPAATDEPPPSLQHLFPDDSPLAATPTGASRRDRVRVALTAKKHDPRCILRQPPGALIRRGELRIQGGRHD
jgi:hypothetical protein